MATVPFLYLKNGTPFIHEGKNYVKIGAQQAVDDFGSVVRFNTQEHVYKDLRISTDPEVGMPIFDDELPAHWDLPDDSGLDDAVE